jgi:hypothetical protein
MEKEKLIQALGPAFYKELSKLHGGSPERWRYLVRDFKTTHKFWPLVLAYAETRKAKLQLVESITNQTISNL